MFVFNVHLVFGWDFGRDCATLTALARFRLCAHSLQGRPAGGCDERPRQAVLLEAGGAVAGRRPGADGSLHRTDEEEWAQGFAVAAGRVSSDQLQDRYSWLDENGKPTMPELKEPKSWQAEAENELTYNRDPQGEPEDDCLNLETEPDFLDTPEDVQAALAALLHPS